MDENDATRYTLKTKYGLDPRRMLDLRRQGLSDEEIAMELGVSLDTVESLQRDIRYEDWKERSKRIKDRLGLI